MSLLRALACIPAVAIAAQLAAQTPTWVRRGMHFESFDPFAHDVVRGRTVTVGRFGTWELAGSDWLARPSAHVPSPRTGHALAFDAGRARVLLFGGQPVGASGFLDDTWTWDGIDWTLQASPVRPTPRRLAQLTYDHARDRVVLFGGSDYVPLRDTWEWNGSTWQNVPHVHQPPAYGRTAYDFSRALVAMLTPGTQVLEHWQWNGTDWLQQTVATPPTRNSYAICEERMTGGILLFGGQIGGVPLNDTWQWNGTNWRQLAPASPPPAFTGHVLVHDVGRAHTLLLGGWVTIGISSSVAFEWDGVNWMVGAATPLPAPMPHVVLGFDPNRQRAVRFASEAIDPWARHETSEWNGSRWLRQSPVVTPGGGGHPDLAFDPIRGEMLLFGSARSMFADGDETWTWNGTAWRQLAPVNRPPVRRWHRMVTDLGRSRVVLFGGWDAQFNPLDDTWEWDGLDWAQQVVNPRPPARNSPTMVYDAARGEVVLFGGETRAGTNPVSLGDTWTWNGSQWTQRTPVTTPPAGARHGVCHDSATGFVVMFGGGRFVVNPPVTSWLAYSDTWLWNGQDWTLLPGAVSPPDAAVAVYEPVFQRILSLSREPAMFAVQTAAVGTYGNGCGGVAGAPRLSASLPTLGASRVLFDVWVPANAPGLLCLSKVAQSLSLGAGCELLVAAPFVTLLFTGSPAGFAELDQGVPRNPNLAGLRVFAQVFALDATAPLGVSATPGLQLDLGS